MKVILALLASIFVVSCVPNFSSECEQICYEEKTNIGRERFIDKYVEYYHAKDVFALDVAMSKCSGICINEKVLDYRHKK